MASVPPIGSCSGQAVVLWENLTQMLAASELKDLHGAMKTGLEKCGELGIIPGTLW